MHCAHPFEVVRDQEVFLFRVKNDCQVLQNVCSLLVNREIQHIHVLCKLQFYYFVQWDAGPLEFLDVVFSNSKNQLLQRCRWTLQTRLIGNLNYFSH